MGEVADDFRFPPKSARGEKVERAVVRDTPERLEALARAFGDVNGAGRVRDLDVVPADEFAVDVDLTEDAA